MKQLLLLFLFTLAITTDNKHQQHNQIHKINDNLRIELDTMEQQQTEKNNNLDIQIMIKKNGQNQLNYQQEKYQHYSKIKIGDVSQYCTLKPDAVGEEYVCNCPTNYKPNAANNDCVLNCTGNQVPNADNTTCQNCQANSSPDADNLVCSCVFGYVLNTSTNTCLTNCSHVPYSIATPDNKSCICIPNYIFGSNLCRIQACPANNVMYLGQCYQCTRGLYAKNNSCVMCENFYMFPTIQNCIKYGSYFTVYIIPIVSILLLIIAS